MSHDERVILSHLISSGCIKQRTPRMPRLGVACHQMQAQHRRTQYGGRCNIEPCYKHIIPLRNGSRRPIFASSSDSRGFAFLLKSGAGDASKTSHHRDAAGRQ